MTCRCGKPAKLANAAGSPKCEMCLYYEGYHGSAPALTLIEMIDHEIRKKIGDPIRLTLEQAESRRMSKEWSEIAELERLYRL